MARLEKLKAIIEPVGGSVIDDSNGDLILIEVPSDAAIWLHPHFGIEGFNPVKLSEAVERNVSGDFREGRRIGKPKPMNFYRYNVDLKLPAPPSPAPTPAEITKQSGPHREGQ